MLYFCFHVTIILSHATFFFIDHFIEANNMIIDHFIEANKIARVGTHPTFVYAKIFCLSVCLSVNKYKIKHGVSLRRVPTKICVNIRPEMSNHIHEVTPNAVAMAERAATTTLITIFQNSFLSINFRIKGSNTAAWPAAVSS